MGIGDDQLGDVMRESTQIAVSPEFGMTGEVSLRGVVTSIGGLPEKLMAAMRAGLKTIFIPKDNEDDLDEVSDEVKNSLEIIPAETVEEVLEKTGIRQNALSSESE